MGSLDRFVGRLIRNSLATQRADETPLESLLSDLIPDEGPGHPLKTYVLTGVLQPLPAGALPGTVNAAQRNRLYLHRSSFRYRPSIMSPFQRRILYVAAEVESGTRERLGEVAGIQSWDLGGILWWLGRVSKSEVRVEDVEALGPKLGWGTVDLGAYVTTNSPGELRGISNLQGFTELVERSASAIVASIGSPAGGHTEFWNYIGRVDDRCLVKLARPICEAATANSAKARQGVAPLLERIPSEVCIAQLKVLGLEGKASQRGRSITVMGKVAGPGLIDEVRRWVEESMDGDRSDSVREAISSLEAYSRQTDCAVELPQPELDVISKSYFTHKCNYSAALVDCLNARPNQICIAVALWHINRNQRGVLSGINSANLARLFIVPKNKVSHVTNYVVSLGGGDTFPSPLMVTAVAANDSIASNVAAAVIGSMFGSGATEWTVAELEEWVNYDSVAVSELLETRLDQYYYDRNGFLDLLEAVGVVPELVRASLAKAAVNGYKSEREHIYRIVGSEYSENILPFLSSRKASERLGAANWLRSHPVDVAVEAVLAATRKEKDANVKGALLASLDALGEPLDEFISRESLLADAERGLAKKGSVPKAMSWLNVESLPRLSWQDGSTVNLDIVEWVLATAVKAKTAEVSPLVARHFASMDAKSVCIFGGTLLDLWMAEDTRSEVGPGGRVFIVGSATPSKGLLSIVAAASGGEIAGRSLSYITKHRGKRVNQVKALLQMLAWISDPAAVQALMAVATRFRPVGIQNEAQNQAELLASRNGWTMEDLADRSVPDGGFNEFAIQTYSYGDRAFTASLSDDLAVLLTNDQTGKTIRALPKGRADEDAELIKLLRKELADTKKELKAVAKLQPGRLNLAMATQREWSTSDFDRYFLSHPVMIRLATRLVWTAESEGGSLISFRPLTDGSLIGADDEDVALSGSERIGIAHSETLPVEAGKQWRGHFEDYEIGELFSQFGSVRVDVAPSQTDFDDLTGFMFTERSLRSAIARFDWQLGTPQDAGIVYEIVRTAPSVGLTAVVELIGGTPIAYWDGSWSCALGKFYFVPADAKWADISAAVPFSKVPRILLSEFYTEAKAIADSGTGFDPDYQQKVGH